MAALTAMTTFLAANAATISTIATAAGTAVAAAGAIGGGIAAKNAAEFKARQDQQAAGEARASANRMMQEKLRHTRLAGSALTARAAASGAAADDPTVLNLEGDIAQRGEYQALLELWKGESRARGLEDSAVASRASGEAAMTGSLMRAGGTILSGAGSFFQRYGGSGFSAPADRRSIDQYVYG